MGRNRVYASAAERQKAYRARTATGQPTAVETKRTKRPQSRPARLQALITAILALKTEYEGWRARLPDFREGSDEETRVTETIDLLDQAADTLSEIEPPRGYGRD